jgi:hypothetical protein
MCFKGDDASFADAVKQTAASLTLPPKNRLFDTTSSEA